MLGHTNSCPVLFQELILDMVIQIVAPLCFGNLMFDLLFVGKLVLFWEFIPPGCMDSYHVLFRELICDLFENC